MAKKKVVKAKSKAKAPKKVAKAAKFDNYESVVASGSTVADAIVAYAAKNKIDHIVMGTNTTNELARLFLGSVATAVVSHASAPVTIARL